MALKGLILVVAIIGFASCELDYADRLRQISARRRNEVFSRDVLRTVDNTLETLGDFSSLNENYIDNIELLKEMTEYFAKELPGISFDMHAVTDWQMSEETPRIIGLQMNIGLFDVAENSSIVIGNFKIERLLDSNGVDVLKVNSREIEFYCLAFSLNVFMDNIDELQCECSIHYLNSFTINSESGSMLLTRPCGFEDCLKEIQLVVETSAEFLRAHVEEQSEEDEMFTEEQVKTLREDTKEWLEYLAKTFLYRFSYALLEMTREQILATNEINIEAPSSVITNMYVLNQQLFEVQKRVGLLPMIAVFGADDFIKDTYIELQWEKSRIYELVEKIQIEYKTANDFMNYCDLHPREQTGYFSASPSSSKQHLDFSLNLASGVVAKIGMEITCEWHKNTKATFTLKRYVSLFTAQSSIVCTPVFQNKMDILFTTASALPTDIRSDVQLTFTLTGSGSVTFSQATALSLEENGVMVYGLRLEKIHEHIVPDIFAYAMFREIDVSGYCHEPCKNCYFIKDGTIMQPNGGFLDADFYTFPVPMYLKKQSGYPSRVHWNDDLNIVANAKHKNEYISFVLRFDQEKSSKISQIAKYQLDQYGNNMPYSQSNSINLITLQLISLSNEVQKLEDRIDDLETAVYQNDRGFFWFLENALSFIDIAFNVIELAKFAIPINKNNHNALKRKDTHDKPLAIEFEHKTKIANKASSYSVLDGINAASQVNILQGHKKTHFYDKSVSKLEIKKISLKDVLNNRHDVREVMELNAAVYSQVQSVIFDSIGKKGNLDFAKQPFGRVSIHKSPIEVPVGTSTTKYLSKKFSGTQSGRAFLANEQQHFPFHTSVSSNAVEIRKDGKIVLNTRFTGVAEPSIIGPTNAKNRRVKIGYVKTQHEILTKDDVSTLKLLPWHATEITPGRFYKKEEVDELFRSFFTKNKNSKLTTDDKWQLIVQRSAVRMNTRNTIDYVPLQSNIFLGALDELMFFSKEGGEFKYNLLNNNCQTFARAYAQMATQGYTQIDLVASDFRAFAQRVARFSENYFRDSPAMQKVVQYTRNISSKFTGFIAATNKLAKSSLHEQRKCLAKNSLYKFASECLADTFNI